MLSQHPEDQIISKQPIIRTEECVLISKQSIIRIEEQTEDYGLRSSLSVRGTAPKKERRSQYIHEFFWLGNTCSQAHLLVKY